MGQGPGRNTLCWCGSNKKYKRCHLDRDRESMLQPWEVDQRLRKCYGAKRCMVPADFRGSCSNDIVRAHTVPRSASLKRIAREGHVYAFVPSVQAFAVEGDMLTPELVGISRVSTFTGFCGHHDKELFAPVKDEPIVFSHKQCFLLGYRSMARETFLKEAQLESMGLLREADKGRDLEDQVAIQQFVATMGIGVAVGAKDALRHKEFYDKILISGDFSAVRAYVVTFARVPPVMCSGGLFPYETFDGTKAQEFSNLARPADAIHYTSFAAGDVGAVVFTWLPDSDETCDRFIRALERVPDENLAVALVRFFFEYCENIQISPEWWDGLDESVREALARRFSSAVDPTVERRPGCLLDNGPAFDDWGVRTRYRVGPINGSS